jgi:hypothetical protein
MFLHAMMTVAPLLANAAAVSLKRKRGGGVRRRREREVGGRLSGWNENYVVENFIIGSGIAHLGCVICELRLTFQCRACIQLPQQFCSASSYFELQDFASLKLPGWLKVRLSRLGQ